MDTKMAYANLIYLGLYRLAIIAAGITSIVLGYLLFVKGVFPYADSTGSGFTPVSPVQHSVCKMPRRVPFSPCSVSLLPP
jgi:hypothetical protein